jgi:hypothetical protein
MTCFKNQIYQINQLFLFPNMYVCLSVCLKKQTDKLSIQTNYVLISCSRVEEMSVLYVCLKIMHAFAEDEVYLKK